MTPENRQKFYERASLVLLGLSFCYFMAELVFNVSLLDVAGTASSTEAEVERVQTFGRVISGVGCTLLVVGFFARNALLLDMPLYKIAAWVLVGLGLLPFAVASGFGPFESVAGHEHDPELIWGLLPLLGGILMLWRARPLARSRTLIGLVLVAWPAMFFGQKILIERYLIEPTTAEDRLNARYMSALRTTFEYCLFEIGDLTFCDHGRNRPDSRSMLGMSAALFMQKPELVTDLARNHKDRILRYLSLNDRLFAPDEQYEYYLGMAAGFYDAYLETAARLQQQLYAPYAEAVSRYQQARSPEALQNMSQNLNTEVDNMLEKSWQTYRDAVAKNDEIITNLARSLKDRIDRQKMLREYAKGKNCEDGNCSLTDRLKSGLRKRLGGGDDNKSALDCESQPTSTTRKDERKTRTEIVRDLFNTYMCQDVDEEELAAKIAELSAREFEKESGYPPDLDTRDKFLNHPRTLELVRDKLPKLLSERFPGLTGALGSDWTPDATGRIVTKVVSYIAGQADKQWSDAMQKFYGADIPPGLSMAEFINNPAVVALMERMAEKMGLGKQVDFSLSQNDFTERIMIPQNTKIIMDMLAEMQKDAESYGNGQALAEDGRQYVRAAYIPAIALGLSLFIIILTLAKNSTALLNIVLTHAGAPEAVRTGVAVSIMGGAVLLVTWVPWHLEGPGDHSRTYNEIQRQVQEDHHLAGLAIDWTLRMQPIIYQLGQGFVTHYRHAGLPDPLGLLPDERRHYVPDPPPPEAETIDTSEMLREAQVDLVMLGYLDESAITARPNAATDEAVRRFREANNMPGGAEITPDLARRLMIYTRTLSAPESK